MAGRGTDIALGEGVEALGGLCVILTEYHESPRIDRQLFGRCARQGQPGECMAIISLEDDLLVQHRQTWQRWLDRILGGAQRSIGGVPRWWVRHRRRAAQARAEGMHTRTRRDTTHHDRELERAMGFSGDPL